MMRGMIVGETGGVERVEEAGDTLSSPEDDREPNGESVVGEGGDIVEEGSKMDGVGRHVGGA